MSILLVNSVACCKGGGGVGGGGGGGVRWVGYEQSTLDVFNTTELT